MRMRTGDVSDMPSCCILATSAPGSGRMSLGMLRFLAGGKRQHRESDRGQTGNSGGSSDRHVAPLNARLTG